MPSLTPRVVRFVRTARVAHLATADRKGWPLVVPICFVLDGKAVYSPIDEKPKTALPQGLRRVRNIRENRNVSLVIDRYNENWRRLAYVLITGTARILTRGKSHSRAVSLLRRKYPQYRRMAIHDKPIIQISVKRLKSWGAL